MGVRPRQIDVRIEELILHGVTPGNAIGVGEAVERELSRLLAERGLPNGIAAGGALDRVDAGAFASDAVMTPTSVGGEVARAVYGGLTR